MEGIRRTTVWNRKIFPTDLSHKILVTTKFRAGTIRIIYKPEALPFGSAYPVSFSYLAIESPKMEIIATSFFSSFLRPPSGDKIIFFMFIGSCIVNVFKHNQPNTTLHKDVWSFFDRAS